jgi:protein-disulfide isomerase
VHDGLFATQNTWKESTSVAAMFTAYARELKLDMNAFNTCYGSQETARRIDSANRLADELGVRATPTFFINGVRVEGALPAQEFRALLHEALRASGPK